MDIRFTSLVMYHHRTHALNQITPTDYRQPWTAVSTFYFQNQAANHLYDVTLEEPMAAECCQLYFLLIRNDKWQFTWLSQHSLKNNLQWIVSPLFEDGRVEVLVIINLTPTYALFSQVHTNLFGSQNICSLVRLSKVKVNKATHCKSSRALKKINTKTPKPPCLVLNCHADNFFSLTNLLLKSYIWVQFYFDTSIIQHYF